MKQCFDPDLHSENQGQASPLKKDSTESVGWRNDDLNDFIVSDEDEPANVELNTMKSRFFDV